MALAGLFQGLPEPNHFHISLCQTLSHGEMIQKMIAVEVVAVVVVVDAELPPDS